MSVHFLVPWLETNSLMRLSSSTIQPFFDCPSGLTNFLPLYLLVLLIDNVFPSCSSGEASSLWSRFSERYVPILEAAFLCDLTRIVR